MVSGLGIALLALSFAVVYLPSRIFHLAMGGIFATAPFVAHSCIQAGLPWTVALGISVMTCVLLSLLCEIANHSPLDARSAPSGVHFVSSLGILVVISQILVLSWGSETRALRTGISPSWSAGLVSLTVPQGLILGVSIFLLAGFYAWLRFGQIGLQFRAVADNPIEYALRGYNPRRIRLVAFGLSGFLAACAALTTAYDYGYDAFGGMPALLLAVVAFIIGGRDSFLGPLVGGLLIGVIRVSVSWFLSASWQDGVTFLILAVFLIARPSGILGDRSRLEAVV